MTDQQGKFEYWAEAGRQSSEGVTVEVDDKGVVVTSFDDSMAPATSALIPHEDVRRLIAFLVERYGHV